MTLGELISVARKEAGDTVKPYLWSDDEWTEYAVDAENEACRRARLIVDSTDPEITQITVLAGTASYTLDDRVIFIRRAKLASRVQPLEKISYKRLDDSAQGWETETGEPRGYITDLDTGKIRPWPTATADDTLNLTVVRLPLVDMKDKDRDSPEIHRRFHRSLVFWMLHRAYSKQDSETLDKQKAADNEGFFEREFGKRSSAVDETWIDQQHGYDTADGVY